MLCCTRNLWSLQWYFFVLFVCLFVYFSSCVMVWVKVVFRKTFVGHHLSKDYLHLDHHTRLNILTGTPGFKPLTKKEFWYCTRGPNGCGVGSGGGGGGGGGGGTVYGEVAIQGGAILRS